MNPKIVPDEERPAFATVRDEESGKELWQIQVRPTGELEIYCLITRIGNVVYGPKVLMAPQATNHLVLTHEKATFEPIKQKGSKQ